ARAVMDARGNTQCVCGAGCRDDHCRRRGGDVQGSPGTSLKRPADEGGLSLARLEAPHRQSVISAAGSSAVSTLCAQACSRVVSQRRICCLTARICEGCMEKLRNPSPKSRRVMVTSPAISPHTLTPFS